MNQETYELTTRLIEWHEERIGKIVEFIGEIKEGATMTVDDTGEEITFNAEQVKFLHMGISTATNFFAELMNILSFELVAKLNHEGVHTLD